MSGGVYRVKIAGHDTPTAVRRVGDLDLMIDRPKGTQRTWNLPDGPVTRTYPTDYGYLPGHKGEDGDALDFFVGSDPNKGWHGSFHQKAHEFEGKVRTGRTIPQETKYFTGLTPEEHAEVLKMYGGPSDLVSNHRFFSSMPGLQGALARHREAETKLANAMIRRMMHFEDLASDKAPAMKAISSFAKGRLEDAQRVVPKAIKPIQKLGPVRGVAEKLSAHKRVTFLGYDFKIDRPKGFVKKWKGGKEFTYPCDYGYFPQYLGEDGEGLDAFVGHDPDGTFESFLKLKPGDDGKMVPDETKFLLGVSAADKKKIYALYGKEVSERKTYTDMEEAMKAADKFKGKQRFAKKAEAATDLRGTLEAVLRGKVHPADAALTHVGDVNDEAHRNRVLGALHAARLLGLDKLSEEVEEPRGLKDDAYRLMGAGALGFGAQRTSESALEHLLGAQRFSHGTSVDTAQKIRKEGLRPEFGGASHGASAAIGNEDYTSATKGKTHIFTGFGSEGMAQPYADVTETVKRKGKLDPLDAEAIFTGMRGKGGPKGEVLNGAMPFDSFKKNFEPDPDARFASRSNKGVPAEYFTQGRAGYKAIWRGRAESLRDYVRNNPRRVAEGAGLAALTAGMGYGAYRLGKSVYDRHAQPEEKLSHRANPFGQVQGPLYLQADQDEEFDASPDFWRKR